MQKFSEVVKKISHPGECDEELVETKHGDGRERVVVVVVVVAAPWCPDEVVAALRMTTSIDLLWPFIFDRSLGFWPALRMCSVSVATIPPY